MLNLNGITVRLGGNAVLDGASAALPTGARVGLVGRNGAGKSTLMRVLTGQIEPDDGEIEMPKRARLGYLAQEAPGGSQTPFETVLDADLERTRLLAEAEGLTDAERLADIHERLNAIDAHAAPARAAKILVGLGFDEEMQARPLDSFSGGWRMRVALAALLFSDPDLLLLDEPSNHLDLEATLWLESFLKAYRGTMLVVSHERDLLNNVVDHVLHLDHGQTTLYQGGYDAFERQRSERMAQAEATREKQLAQRAKLQSFVDRWGAKAHTARQAQSRMKALARMEPVAAALEDPSLSFDFPSPNEMRPPLMVIEGAAVGYVEGQPILRGLDMRIDPDDRIALLGRNGNGKTTLARLLAGQLAPMAGEIVAGGKLRVGYFTQYQVEELDGSDTPLQHMARLMPDAPPKIVRAQLGRFGFSGERAMREVGKMSGGERARLALALVTRDAPHMLILDEPTNHLDVDAREALVQALGAYDGAVVVVSHDRHMLELTADRLMLVDGGTATEFDGSLEDYTDLILGREAKKNRKPVDAPQVGRKEARRAAAEARERTQGWRKTVQAAEAEIAKLEARKTELDRAMFDPGSAAKQDADRSMTELMKLRADAVAGIEAAEARWIEASEAIEGSRAA
ncbi:ABC-F family ATP-binding cassette domain-containing protein [Qipengyuania sp. DY56-A-20]|uniref:ABC-F family ATP-binding cassette domain-containing protein n=1 Tax=Qipengyuania benthica TaxID=3067651 RepID=A0ABT9H647_9SPHN|nr:ABC-F family ATP-binding cassette domain-containing protein [Qipengyuania sp. DY56-A-20]MBU1254692.1 ABC-F family ATP-binding cassette domain-containing protein [Alphaproteobacteria bacterium]MDP4538783.1 ABC-F family ATP-binding cassette domain-containing protein [Qipengyuania sp. DY56-A-20]